MKTALATAILAMALLGDDRPTSRESCDGDEFANGPGPYELARPKPGTKPKRIDAADDCLSEDLDKCNKIPLEETTTWIAGNRKGDWVCVADGTKFGWTKKDELDLTPAPNHPIKDWLGTWNREAGQATVKIQKKEDGLQVTGEATWLSGPEAVPHLGTLEAKARPTGIELVLGDGRCVAPDRSSKTDTIPDCWNCHARLLLIGSTLIITDNHNCGGMNVNFDGVYRRGR